MTPHPSRAFCNLFPGHAERCETDRSVSVSNVDVQTKRCVPNLVLKSAFRWQTEYRNIFRGRATAVNVRNGRGGGVAEHGKRVQALPLHRRAEDVGFRIARLSGIIGH